MKCVHNLSYSPYIIHTNVVGASYRLYIVNMSRNREYFLRCSNYHIPFHFNLHCIDQLNFVAPATVEAPAEEDNATAAEESKTEEESAPAAASADAPAAENADSAKDEAADDAETTTKQQARGLGLLTQRRRLPLRKPGTIL